MNANFVNRYTELQMSINESVAVLTLMIDALEEDTSPKYECNPVTKLALNAALANRVTGIYAPAMSMVFRNLSGANERAKELLEELNREEPAILSVNNQED